jgi:hypothetical protein
LNIDGGVDLTTLLHDDFIQKYGTITLTNVPNAQGELRVLILFFFSEPTSDLKKIEKFARAMIWRCEEYEPDPSTIDPLRLCFTSHPRSGKLDVIGNFVDKHAFDEIISLHEEYLATNSTGSNHNPTSALQDEDEDPRETPIDLDPSEDQQAETENTEPAGEGFEEPAVEKQRCPPKEKGEYQADYIERVLKSTLDPEKGRPYFDLFAFNGEEGIVYYGEKHRFNNNNLDLILATFDEQDRPPSKATIVRRIVEIANRRKFYPITDYLTKQTWDGVSRIDHIAEHFLEDDDRYVTYADGTVDSYRKVLLKKWLVGAVRKVKTKGHWQNPMLVMSGEEGIGKSEMAKWLCSRLGKEYFVEMPIDPKSNDHRCLTGASLIWEVGELGSTTTHRDWEALKAFLTTRTFTVRRPYAPLPGPINNLCSFFGTHNPTDGPFLFGAGINRRFWVLNIIAIDWEYTKLDVNQVWAEANHLESNGFNCALTPEENLVREEVNRGHNIQNTFEDAVRQFCIIKPDQNTFTSSFELVSMLTRVGQCRGKSDRAIQMQLANAMNKLGVEQWTPIIDGKQQRGYRGITINYDAVRAFESKQKT